MALADKLNNLDTDEVANGALHVLNSLQDLQPSIQMAALMALTGTLMKVFDLDIRNEIERLERLVANAEHNGWDKKFAAVRAYIEGELKAHK